LPIGNRFDPQNLRPNVRNAKMRELIVSRFLVRLDQMALRGHVDRIGCGRAFVVSAQHL
jgi:hypothetical protein